MYLMMAVCGRNALWTDKRMWRDCEEQSHNSPNINEKYRKTVNNKFWEELIAYFPFTTICIYMVQVARSFRMYVYGSQYKNIIWEAAVFFYRWEGFVKYAEMALGGHDIHTMFHGDAHTGMQTHTQQVDIISLLLCIFYFSK
jgi:hypothetical protein